MRGIYFPGCELSSDDEKIRLLTKDKENITVSTATTRAVSKYYFDLIPRDVSQYFVDILIDTVGEDFYKTISLKDALNIRFINSLRTARECKQLGLRDNEQLSIKDEQDIFGYALLDYVCSMSYQGQTAKTMYGYDIVKEKYDEFVANNKDYVFARLIYDYLAESGYVEEAEAGYKQLYNTNKEVSDNDIMMEEKE